MRRVPRVPTNLRTINRCKSSLCPPRDHCLPAEKHRCPPWPSEPPVNQPGAGRQLRQRAGAGGRDGRLPAGTQAPPQALWLEPCIPMLVEELRTAGGGIVARPVPRRRHGRGAAVMPLHRADVAARSDPPGTPHVAAHQCRAPIARAPSPRARLFTNHFGMHRGWKAAGEDLP